MAAKSDKKSEVPQDDNSLTHPPYRQVIQLLAWEAPGRPFKKRNKSYFTSSILITLLICIILFVFAQYMLIFVVLSLVFVSFALATVPPHNFHYRVSSEGVMVEDHFFLWGELYDFYFKTRFNDITILHIRTRALLPGEITLTLGDVKPDKIKGILLHYLPYREYVNPTFMEKSGDWLSKNFPLEKTSEGKSTKVAS